MRRAYLRIGEVTQTNQQNKVMNCLLSNGRATGSERKGRGGGRGIWMDRNRKIDRNDRYKFNGFETADSSTPGKTDRYTDIYSFEPN